jgi:hypothetical protein
MRKKHSFLSRAAMTLLVMMLTTVTAWADWTGGTYTVTDDETINSTINSAADVYALVVASGECGTTGHESDVTWSLNEFGEMTISGTGEMCDFDDENNFFPAISDSVKQNCIVKVVIEEGVTTIGKGAFNSFYALAELSLPSTLNTIGDYAFFDCDGLTTVDLPDGVTSIGEQAFYDCDELCAITLSSKLESIGDYAFYYTNLGSVNIPASVTSIGDYAFLNAGLKAINVDSKNSKFESIDGVLFDKGHTKLIQYPALNDATTYMVPDGVKTIGLYAFDSSTSLTSIVLSSSVTAFEKGAFANCSNLESINIPDCLTEIAARVFESCSSLTSFVIPDGVTSIGEYAFYGCEKIESVVIPSSVKTIDKDAFNNDKALQSLFLPEGVTTLGAGAFEQCHKLHTITIPSSMTQMDIYAFGWDDAVTDIYCCADPDKLDNYDKFRNAYLDNKATKCHVYADKLAAYEAKYPNANVTFVGDLQTVSAKENEDYFWTTFYSGTTGYKINDDVNADAYTATVEASKIKLHKLGKVIPAGTAVIIAGKKSNVNMIIDNESEAENIVDNQLKGVDAATAQEAGYYYYVLSKKSDNFGFYKLASTKQLGANKAFIKIPENAFSAREFFGLEEETTNIEHSTFNIEHSNDSVYDLLGRKVVNPQKGLYIVNGRKEVVK